MSVEARCSKRGRRGSPLRRCSRRRERRSCPRWRWSSDDVRWTITVLPAQRVPTALWMSVSFSGSSEAVASSRSTTGASFRRARAMERRWRSPPERAAPFSPSIVPNPWGSLSMNSMQCGRPRRFRHFLISCSLAADSDVVRDRVVEKDHVLKDYGDVREPRFLGEPGDVLARAEDPAAVRLPEFRRQLGAGRLARAARPDEGGDFSFLRVEADAVEDLLVAVPEPDVLER